jgi:TrmH family RNA methyltransferase
LAPSGGFDLVVRQPYRANEREGRAVDLTSPANPRVRALARLRRRRTRDERALTLVEGHDELMLAVDAGARPVELVYEPARIRPEHRADLERIAALGARLTTVGRAVFDKLAYRQSPDGWLGVVPTPGGGLAGLALPAQPLLLVCEGIEKPGNLGALVRTAEALGLDAVISADGVTDFGNPNAVRASKGTVFAVPLAAAPAVDVLEWLRAGGIRTVVTTPGGTTPLADADLSGPVAVVVGSEQAGVSAPWLESAGVTAAIPMHGSVNSLNAAASGAIAMYEAVRRRR